MVFHQHCSTWRWEDHHEHFQLQVHYAVQNITALRITRESHKNETVQCDMSHINQIKYEHRQLLNAQLYTSNKKLEAKDVLPNIKCMQAAEKAEKCRVLSLVTLTLTFKLVRVRDQTRLPCKFGANPFSSSGDISYTNKKTTDWRRQKQNLPKFTACG